jgi:hypothetical protein
MYSQPIPIAEIAAVTRERLTHPSDRGSKRRELARRQLAYANLLAKLDAFLFLLEEGPPPELVLRSSTTEVALGLGDAVREVEPILRDLLDEKLGQMETHIVGLHLAIEREEQETLAHPSAEVDYAVAVLHLCGITEELPIVSVPTSAPVSPPDCSPVNNARNPRTATTAPGTGLDRAGSDANASRRTPLNNRGFDNQATVAA